MIKQLILALALLAVSHTVLAQTTTLLEDSEAKTIDISYIESSENNFNNTYLEILSKSTGENINTIKLEYTLKEYRKITLRGGKINLTVALGNFVLQDEHEYLKFSVNKLLKPSLVTFTYHWVDEEGNTIESATLTNQTFKSGANVLKLSKIDNGDGSNSRLYFSNIQFSFSKSNFKKFDNFISAVDTYYDSDARLNMLNSELDNIRTDTLELLENFHQTTLNNIKYFNQLKSQRLNSTLSLAAHDPISFKSSFGKTEVRNREIKKELEYTLKNMHQAYYDKGMDWIKWNNTDSATTFFHRSINEKEQYAPPYYQLALLDFYRKNYQPVLDSCAIIISTRKPDTDTRYSTIKLAEKVISIYLKEALELVNDEHYNIALKKLEYCKNYSKAVDGLRYFEEFDSLHSKIFQGFYDNLAVDAKQYIENNQLTKATQSIDSLSSFRNSYKQYHIEPAKENELLRKLYSAWLKKGNDYLKREVSDSAVFALTHAKIICDKHYFVECTKELDQLLLQAHTINYKLLLFLAKEAITAELADSALSILHIAKQNQKAYRLAYLPKADTLYLEAKQLKYNGLISIGTHALNGGDGQQALAYFEEAIVISKEIEVTKDTSLNGKIQEAAIAYIMTICSRSETYIEAMQMEKAQSGLNMVNALKNKYILGSNSNIVKAIEHLASLLNQGKCNIVQHNFNIQYGATKIFIDKLDFTNAQNAIEKAKDITRQTPDCNINKDELIILENSIHGILAYQNKNKKIDKMLNKKNFLSAIHAYNALTNYYNDSVENNYGIPHKELYSYLIENENSNFINYAVIFYTEQSEPAKALELLQELYKRDYIASWSKESQSSLGAYLANRDFDEKNEEDPKLKVNDYTNDIVWFKYLKKAYLGQWKGLM